MTEQDGDLSRPYIELTQGEDGSVEGDIEIPRGYEVTFGVTPDGTFYQRVQEITDVIVKKEVLTNSEGYTFIPNRGELVKPNGEVVRLTPKQVDVVQQLWEKPGICIKSEDFERMSDKYEAKVYVSRIRRKVDDKGALSKDSFIGNNRGHGYYIRP